jgi:hypothetical protein
MTTRDKLPIHVIPPPILVDSEGHAIISEEQMDIIAQKVIKILEDGHFVRRR